jgi:hypothetical protein|tara:strand:+ start:848 stop:1465 length:618 start_codon:yes stop_codon:yes gene_type:complete
MVGRVIDSLIVFRILKLLTTDFKKTPAYKFGFIDEKGKRIKFLPDPDNKNQLLPNNPKTREEKSALTPLHRLVFNLKKLIRMVPFGKTAFASYAVALALLKEQTKLDSEQTDQLFEKFYHHLKDESLFNADMITESAEVGKLMHNGDYHLRRMLEQNFDENGEMKVYKEKSTITDVKQNSIGYGILIYEGRIENDKILFTAEDVY